jgi:hypothetical protein
MKRTNNNVCIYRFSFFSGTKNYRRVWSFGNEQRQILCQFTFIQHLFHRGMSTDEIERFVNLTNSN